MACRTISTLESNCTFILLELFEVSASPISDYHRYSKYLGRLHMVQKIHLKIWQNNSKMKRKVWKCPWRSNLLSKQRDSSTDGTLMFSFPLRKLWREFSFWKYQTEMCRRWCGTIKQFGLRSHFHFPQVC